MRIDIIRFLKLASKKFHGLEAYYIPDGDLYVVTKNGRAVSNFNSWHFYKLAKYFRLREWRGIINQGLNHNAGEKTVDTVQKRGMGIKINLNG